MRCAKTAEQIEVLFGMETLERPQNIVLNAGLYPHGTGMGGKNIVIVPYINTSVLIHSPDGATFDKAISKLL